MSSKIMAVRKFLSVNDIYNEYLPISKKRIRMMVKQYIPYKMIGGRIYVERTQLEDLLADPERRELSLAS